MDPQFRQGVTHDLFVGGKNKLTSTALQEPEAEVPLPPESRRQFHVNLNSVFKFFCIPTVLLLYACLCFVVFIWEDLLG